MKGELLFGPRFAKRDVDVGVHQAGQDRAAGEVEHFHVMGLVIDRQLLRLTHPADAVTHDDHGSFLNRGCTGTVHHSAR